MVERSVVQETDEQAVGSSAKEDVQQRIAVFAQRALTLGHKSSANVSDGSLLMDEYPERDGTLREKS